MEQFVLVPASVYNKSLNEQSVTKQELPKYQPSQITSRQIDSFKNEANKNCLLKQTLYFFLSSYQALKLADFIFGWSQNCSFTIKLCSTTSSWKRRRSRTLHYLTMLVFHPTLVLNQKATAKERESWVPFKRWRSEAGKVVKTIWCCFWLCVHFSDS